MNFRHFYHHLGAVALASVVTSFLIASSNAFASDSPPYSPAKLKTNEVVSGLTYEKPPISLPFQEKSSSIVADGRFYQFQSIYSNSYDEIVNYFTNAMKSHTLLPILNSKVVPYSTTDNVNVIGRTVDDREATFHVAVEDKPYTITLHIYPDYNGTRIVIPALIQSTVYSGDMPIRAPFKPADANPIPFRWN